MSSKTQQERDPHVSVSFSLPLSVKMDMDRRTANLRMSRTDYLKHLVLAELDKGLDAPFEVIRRAGHTTSKGRKTS